MVATVEVFDKCCKQDFMHSNINKTIKNPETYENVKNIIRENYGILLDIYKYLSSLTVKEGGVFIMSRQLS